MYENPFLGVFFHSLGGFAAASFYLPFKRVRGWSWESYWLVGGVFSWIVAPWVVAVLVVPDLLAVLRETPGETLFWCYFYGVLWGIGGLTFGLSMRYLGMSLGYALALGFCAAFGTLIPPMYYGKFHELATTEYGIVTLLGVAVCLGGIAVCGRAGMRKERELSDEQKRKTIAEFSFVKGVWVAVFAGIMSACMSFGISAGEPIADLAIQHKTPKIWENVPTFIVVLAGGFTTNLIWCVLLNVRNRSGGDYLGVSRSPLAANYLFSALAGTTWYLQFMFYGMGESQMGEFGFASWTIHMAFIIVFANLWALALLEWKGSRPRTYRLITTGIAVLVASTLIVGLGNYLKPPENNPPSESVPAEAAAVHGSPGTSCTASTTT